MADELTREEMGSVLSALAEEEPARSYRIAASKAVAQGLSRVGLVLWVHGATLGPHRAAGVSTFGDDRVVGLATVAQTAGELGRGAVSLLEAENRYAASALARQLLEVEYLAHEFATDGEAAAAWLRADENERRMFWSPQRLRNRSGNRAFINEHYWRHCELGGHPTTAGMALLPEHARAIPTALLWVDVASHLAQIWGYVRVTTERLTGSPAAMVGGAVAADKAIERWRRSDGLYAALQDLAGALHDRG